MELQSPEENGSFPFLEEAKVLPTSEEDSPQPQAQVKDRDT